ncbi:MAG: tetratricopeptide repeat protein, partial [Muribaculum sp.]|nr:tetratricopeptide repeat protein [Muribaculum sp.]
YRQTDSTMVELLNRIRIGRPTSDDIHLLNSRLINDRQSEQSGGDMVMTLATKRDMVDSFNQQHLDELSTPAVTFVGEVKDDFPENAYPNQLELTLKVGAQVVFIKNDPDKRWVNGTLGRVFATNKDNIIVETETGEKHTVERAIWNNVKYRYDEKTKKVIEEIVGSFIQFPVKLAWALTIHKSQGLTFSKVNIDIGTGTFSSGQAYVALSRCRSIDGLHLMSTINPRDIFVSPAVLRFSEDFNNNRVITEALEYAQAEKDYHDALKLLRDDDLPGAFEKYISASRKHDYKDNAVILRFIRRELYRRGTYGAVIAQLQAIVDDDRKRFHQLADEYTRLGDDCRGEWDDPTPALANYNKAISLYPQSVEAWLGKGLTLLGIEQFEEAEEALLEVRRLDPENFTAPFRLGQAYHQRGDNILAIDWLKIALKIDDKNPSLHRLLAKVYHALGDETKARRHETKAENLLRRRNKK